VILAVLKKWKFVIFAAIVLVVFLTAVDPLLEYIESSSRTEAPVQTIPQWRRFTNRECGYAVAFPSHPIENPYVLSNRQNVVSYRQFAATLGSNQVFMVATLVTSLTNNLSVEQIDFLMDKTAKGGLGDDGKLLAERKITLGTNMGREIEFEKSDGYFYKMRCYQVGHDLQTLTVRVPLATRESTNVLFFLDSFSLISK
jgi:hypothetical protein